jgi:metal-responsive CopG/Arc/MetJ family transcriptional regulator
MTDKNQLKAVSIRLPIYVIEKIDKQAIYDLSNRSSVIMRLMKEWADTHEPPEC